MHLKEFLALCVVLYLSKYIVISLCYVLIISITLYLLKFQNRMDSYYIAIALNLLKVIPKEKSQ